MSPTPRPWCPELALFSVSYLFKDRDHYERVINDPKFRERIESLVAGKNLGIKVIGYYAAGVRNIYTRRGPAATPDDLKGTKIRVMNNPVEAKIWNTLGAIPTPMNFGEVYQSLQSGVLDAAENAPGGHRIEPPLRGGQDHHPDRAPALDLAAGHQRTQVQRPVRRPQGDHARVRARGGRARAQEGRRVQRRRRSTA